MKHVLVIDDEVDSAEMLRMLLELEGYRADTAHNGREGLAKIAADRPDLIVLDLMMPIMSGWEVLDALAQDPKLSDIPVIISSAADARYDARKYGHACVRKPIELKRLRSLVRELTGEG